MLARALLAIGIFWAALAQAQFFTLRISVELGNHRLLDATVSASNVQNGHVYTFQFDSLSQAYICKDMEHGRILVRVSAPNCETEERYITVREDDKRRLEQRFVMGERGSSFFYIDKMRYPFTEEKRILIVRIKPNTYKTFEQWTMINHLNIVQVRSDIVDVYGVVGKKEALNASACKALASLRSQAWVEYAGVSLGEYAVLTNAVSVRIVTSADLNAMEAFLKKQGFTVVKKVSDTNWQCKAPSSWGYKLNTVCKALIEHPEIEGVLPDMRELFFAGED